MSEENPTIQKIQEGYGPKYHRLYSVSFPIAMQSKLEKVMLDLQADMNAYSPQLIAKFEKTKGEPNKLQKGDEYLIRITGPWNGPVRVMEVSPTEFKLATLDGHLEAGEITFRIWSTSNRAIFEIESLARSRDIVVDLLYDKIAIAKFAQTEMWDSFCKAVAEDVTGSKEKTEEECGKVDIITQRYNEKSGKWETM